MNSKIPLLFFLPWLLLTSACKENETKIQSGTIIYLADYPLQKKNAFLYSILPKEMEVQIRDGYIKNSINRANLQNSLLMNCNQKEMDIYFQYAEEAYTVKLTPSEIKKMLADQEKYDIKLIDETATIVGLKAKKAIATNRANKKDIITLWYTEDIELKNANWYNTFHQIPGVLLAYSVHKYGIRMDYKAVKFIPDTTNNQIEKLALPVKGTAISYAEYNKKMESLFTTFE